MKAIKTLNPKGFKFKGLKVSGFKPRGLKPKHLLTLLRQPTSIAAIASVGIHSILFAASPRLSQLSLASIANPDAGNAERNVPLVELSPAEQSRLPDFSNQQFSLIPNGNVPSSFQFPLGVPNTGTANSNTNTNSNSNSNTPSFGQVGVPRGLFGGGGFNQSGTSTYLGGAGVQINGGQTSIGVNTQQNSSQSPDTTEADENSSNSSTATDSSQASENPDNNQAQTNGGIQEIQPEEIARLSESDPNNLQFDVADSDLQANAGSDVAPNAPDAATVDNPTANESTTTAQSFSGETAPNTDASGLLSDEAIAFLDRYPYSPERTTADYIEGQQQAWLTAAQTISGNPELQPLAPIDLSITYAEPYCLAPPPTTAQVGALFTGQGDLSGEPTVLMGTGYLPLDELAKAEVLASSQSAQVSGEEGFTAKLFNVSVNYNADDCIELTARAE